MIAVLALSIAWGAWRGLVHEVLSLAGWIMAFLAANLLAAPLSETFPGQHAARSSAWSAPSCWSSSRTLVLTTLLTALVTKFIRVSVLQSLDRWLGALFGLLRGLLILVVPSPMVAGLTSLPRHAGVDANRRPAIRSRRP